MRGKFTAPQVAEIRAHLQRPCAGCARKPTMEDLALSYGVTASAIYEIAHGRTWKTVAPAAADAPLPPIASEQLVRDVLRTVSKRYPHAGMQLGSAIKLTIALTIAALPRNGVSA